MCKTYPQLLFRKCLTGELEFTILINMTKHKIITTINKEINKINDEIDMKILQGLAYRAEARRHKMLLNKLRSEARPSWQYRLSRMVTSFLL